ncbi:hypothetical protein U879_09430, partial [Defluviimonas sp. 20V17]
MSDTAPSTAEAHLEEELIRRATLNYESLPMLEVIAERMVLSLTSSFKTLTASVAEAKMRDFRYASYGDAMAALPRHGMLAVCQATPWGGHVLVSMDGDFVFSALELMLGGRAERITSRPVERGFTSIERRMGQRLAEVVLKDLAEALHQVAEVELKVERMEVNPQFAIIAQPSSPAVLMQIDVVFEASRGKIALVLPYGTLDPVKRKLTKVFYGERLGGDDAWRSHFTDRIEHSTISLTAQLHERSFPMAEVLGWKVGDTI